MAVLYILFGAAFTISAGAPLGRRLLRSVTGLDPAEVWIFSVLTGAALWSTAMFALAAAGLVHKGVILTLGLAAIVWGARQPWPRLSRPSKWWLAALPFFVLYLANALAPELSPDGSSYHLGLVSRYYRQHGFGFAQGARYENMYAHLSQGMEMLFLSAWAFGRNSGAAMVHFAFQCLLPLMMAAYARRFGLGRVGIAAALLVYATPVVGIDGISAYNDVAGAAVVFGVFYLTELHSEQPHPSLLVPMGLLAGFAFAIKYTLGLAIPYAIARVVWNASGHRLRQASTVAAFALLPVLPWLAKNLWVTGNPVSPLFNAWFPNAYVTPAFEAGYTYYMRHYDGIVSYWQLPAELARGGELLNGFLGPMWLLAPLAIASMIDKRGRALVITGLLFGATYFANIGARFLIPVLPFFALAMVLALRRWPVVMALFAASHAILSWPDVAKQYSAPNAWRLDRIFWKPALRIESEDGFLRRRMSSYAMARLIEEHVPPGDVLLSFNPEAEAYTSREIRVAYQSTANNMAGDLLHLPLMPEAHPRRRISFRFPAQPITGVRLVQTAAHPTDQWYVSELRLLANGREIPRATQWRIRASTNGWYAGLAFDNDPLTRWPSGERLQDGQRLEVTIPETTVDQVIAEAPQMEFTSRYRLEVLRAGQWRKVNVEPEVYTVPSALGLRRAATRAVVRQGIGWVVFSDADFGAKDYYDRRADWGLEYVGSASGRKLYRILR